MSVPLQVREAKIYQKFLKDQSDRQASSTPVQPQANVPSETPDESTAGNFAKSWEYAKRKTNFK